MKPIALPRRQRGVTLVVGLIMLVLITLVVSTAFTMSTTNLKAVGNMQFRDEAIAAANVAVERLMSTDFTTLPQATAHEIDIDNNGAVDYIVDIALPVCVRSTGITNLPATDPDASTCAVGTGATPLCYETVWDLTATVREAEAILWTGARATVRQGVSKRVNVTGATACSL